MWEQNTTLYFRHYLFLVKRQKYEVRKVIGQTITYPNDMECFKGENNHFSPLEEPQMTILVWFDSTECSACKLNGIKMSS